MSIENQSNINTRQFILFALSVALRTDKATLLVDALRTTPLLPKTLMAKIAATGKYVPFTDETATDGTGIPAGIYDPEGSLGEIAAADIAAGDVEDLPILLFGAQFDSEQLIIENSKTLATVIGAGTVQAKTVQDALIEKSLVPTAAISGSSFENS